MFPTQKSHLTADFLGFAVPKSIFLLIVLVLQPNTPFGRHTLMAYNIGKWIC